MGCPLPAVVRTRAIALVIIATCGCLPCCRQGPGFNRLRAPFKSVTRCVAIVFAWFCVYAYRNCSVRRAPQLPTQAPPPDTAGLPPGAPGAWRSSHLDDPVLLGILRLPSRASQGRCQEGRTAPHRTIRHPKLRGAARRACHRRRDSQPLCSATGSWRGRRASGSSHCARDRGPSSRLTIRRRGSVHGCGTSRICF